MTEAPSVETLTDHGRDARAACAWSLHQLDAADLDRTTPCTEFTVAELADHLTMSMTLLAGAAGAELPAPDQSPVAERVLTLADGALAAWQARGYAGDVPVGRRSLPAADAYSIVLLELVVHGWDVARALGCDDRYDVTDDLVAHLREQTPTLIRPEARGRGFAEAVEVGDDATPLQRLLAFTGRTP